MAARQEIDNFKSRFAFELLELMSSSSSSSSDEDEFFKNPHKIRKIENFIELVHGMTDKEFKSHFRVSRSTAYKIIDIYANSQFYPSDRTHGGSKPTSAELHILIDVGSSFRFTTYDVRLAYTNSDYGELCNRLKETERNTCIAHP
ncbi:PREDICTED: uncharacterized protein LOC108776375 [Cyphomyrmex costatus]|uniref:uncharacterized protein LOC108776375 n=1 Tax=Cyphomyrmex costatus TaxID=456900 RepID=UPI00085235FC|nr:PREDICTED: uncharacterized protein LOC108776375 [Cyphomyrmex costatus]